MRKTFTWRRIRPRCVLPRCALAFSLALACSDTDDTDTNTTTGDQDGPLGESAATDEATPTETSATDGATDEDSGDGTTDAAPVPDLPDDTVTDSADDEAAPDDRLGDTDEGADTDEPPDVAAGEVTDGTDEAATDAPDETETDTTDEMVPDEPEASEPLPWVEECALSMPPARGTLQAETCPGMCPADLDECNRPSGDVVIDAYFETVTALQHRAEAIDTEVTSWLNQLVGILGSELGPASAEEASAVVRAAIDGGLNGMLEGGLDLDFSALVCTVDAAEVPALAAACDPNVSPTQTVYCEGACRAPTTELAECPGAASLSCEGLQAQCEGTCRGGCALSAGFCAGKCTGTCEVESEFCPGECLGTLDGSANCIGECALDPGARCPGICGGECELIAGICEGECLGQCEFTPPGGSCDAADTAVCEASAGDDVPCSGSCSGMVETETAAECYALTTTMAALQAECALPDVQVTYVLSADVRAEVSADLDARADLTHTMSCYGNTMAVLLQLAAEAEHLLRATGELVDGGSATVAERAEFLADSGDEGAACGLSLFADAESRLAEVEDSLTASVTAVVSVL